MSITAIVRDLNAVFEFFKIQCAQLNISTDPAEWLVRNQHPSVWEYAFKNPVPYEYGDINEHLNTETVSAIYYTNRFNHLILHLFLETPELRRLFPKIEPIISQNWKITEEQLKPYQRTPKEDRHLVKVAEALERWVEDSNYEKAVRTGKTLETLTPHIPKQLLKSPSSVLYRAIIVPNTLLKKVRNGKDIVLKNRRYSSWCYTLEAAKEYVENSLDTLEMDTTIVILRKKFPKENILLNVEALGLFLAERGLYTRDTDLLEREQEIIVKQDGVFVIHPTEVYLYLNSEDKWVRIK